MDYNMGLTQALSDSTNTYIYGNGRIAQTQCATTDYFLTDALGSVRQLTDTSGAITYASAYDPYGVVTTTSGASGTPYGYTNEYTSQGLVYLRARYYDPAMGRFLTRDTWGGDVNSPMSYNAWLYVYANPINLTDPSGHDPWWCEGRHDEDLCYVKWNLDHGGKLTADAVESIYQSFPDETLQLIQQQFSIVLPAGHSFRMAQGGSAFNPNTSPYENTWGVEWWFVQYNTSLGTIVELSDQQCGLFSSNIPSQALHIDNSTYITEHTFPDWKYSPDDLAGIMIHEAVHAWQENIARSYIVNPGQANDPSSLTWFNQYQAGIERQGVDIALNAENTGRIHMSSRLRSTLKSYRKRFKNGPDFPYYLPINVP